MQKIYHYGMAVLDFFTKVTEILLFTRYIRYWTRQISQSRLCFFCFASTSKRTVFIKHGSISKLLISTGYKQVQRHINYMESSLKENGLPCLKYACSWIQSNSFWIFIYTPIIIWFLNTVYPVIECKLAVKRDTT